MFRSVQYHTNLEKISFKKSSRYLFFIAEKSKKIYKEIHREDIEFYGAVFPQIIYKQQNYDEGILVIEVNEDIGFWMIKDLSAPIAENLESKIENTKSILTIVDGLSAFIQTFLENFYEVTDPTTTIIGGGAGVLTLEQEPVIFDNRGIFQDAGLLIYTQTLCSVGVQHGWGKCEGPFISTHTHNNILKTIDYQGAFDIYKEVVESHSDLRFSETNFFDIAKQFPIGIEQYNKELVVRDPIHTENNALILVGELDQNSTIYILQGEKQLLIQAAKKAAQEADSSRNSQKNGSLFVIDCISRFLYLEDDFQSELKAIHSVNPNHTVFGLLTLGEIANKSKAYIEFYNKTCVVGIFDND